MNRRLWLVAPVLALGMVFAIAPSARADAIDENGDPIVTVTKDDPTAGIKTVASYALVSIGFIVVGLAVRKTLASNMSYPQAKMTLINFLRTNPYQVLTLGKAMEGTFAEPIGAALKAGGTTRTQDPKIVASATQPTYDAIGQGILAKWGATMMKAKLGVMAAVAGGAIGVANGAPIPVILAVLAALGFLKLFLFKNDLEGTLVRARIEVLPEVDAAIVQGRYAVPLPEQPT